MTEAELRIRDQSRLAITVRDPNSNVYPAREDEPNTYWIVFVDGQYTKAQGNQAHALTARQLLTKARALAHNLLDGSDAYVEENTLVEVTWHSRQWWFYYGAQATPTSSSSGSSSDGSSSGSSSGVPAEKCWVGLDANFIHIHKQPLSFTDEADPTLSYDVMCGLTFDDAGHVLGLFDVPWGGNGGGAWLTYSTGTVAIDNGSKTATLSGGTFPTWTAATHYRLTIDGVLYRVASWDSGTQLTLTDAWPLANYSGAYVLDGCGWKSPRSKLPPLDPASI